VYGPPVDTYLTRAGHLEGFPKVKFLWLLGILCDDIFRSLEFQLILGDRHSVDEVGCLLFLVKTTND
jgi:hypothetical protein